MVVHKKQYLFPSLPLHYHLLSLHILPTYPYAYSSSFLMLIDQLCSWQFSFRTVPGKHLFNQKLGNIRNVIAFFGKSEWSHAVRILFFLILRQTFARVKCFLMLSVDVEQIGLAQAWGLLIICCYTLVKLIVDENGSEL